MTRSYPTVLLLSGIGFAVLAVASLGPLAAPPAALAQSVTSEAPPEDRMRHLAVNYSRARPHIATAGLVRTGAIPELKALGFAAIIDLRGADEGANIERRAAEDAGLRYVNIPVTSGAPTDSQVAEFAALVEDTKHFPLLVHCVSANRVGAMWALYRAQVGAPVSLAIEEGRAIGLQPAREIDVRKRLGRQLSAR
jgi:uncharacterized protein (TIGR01244 family)